MILRLIKVKDKSKLMALETAIQVLNNSTVNYPKILVENLDKIIWLQ